MPKIHLTQPAHIETGFMRLPTEDGCESIYVMEGSWYQAEAVDENGIPYLVLWDILEDWDHEDEGAACDWTKPRAIIFAGTEDDPCTRDVTGTVCLA